MTVVKSKRKLSHLEVMHQATKIRKSIEVLCFRNLGIRDTDNIARKKFRVGKDLNFEPLRYYEILCAEKENLRLLAYQAQRYLIGASEIYPKTKQELYLRRNGQDLSIGTYEMILKEFQHICDVFDVDINVYKQYVDDIDYEIRLLKSWRKSDSRFKKDLVS